MGNDIKYRRIQFTWHSLMIHFFPTYFSVEINQIIDNFAWENEGEMFRKIHNIRSVRS